MRRAIPILTLLLLAGCASTPIAMPYDAAFTDEMPPYIAEVEARERRRDAREKISDAAEVVMLPVVVPAMYVAYALGFRPLL